MAQTKNYYQYDFANLRCDSCLWRIKTDEDFFRVENKTICSRCKADVDEKFKRKRY